MGQPSAEIPTTIILAAPGLSKATPNRYPCDLCKEAYPIQVKTRKLLRDLKKASKAALVICYGCYEKNRHRLEQPGSMHTGVSQSRKILGLDENT